MSGTGRGPLRGALAVFVLALTLRLGILVGAPVPPTPEESRVLDRGLSLWIEGPRLPDYDEGVPSFRLEQLTAANGIGHEHAHDALSDVRATIGMARLLRQRQPRLYDYAYRMRDKRRVAELLDTGQPLLHASSRYPAKYCGTALVQPLAPDPNNPQATLVFDLRQDPAQSSSIILTTITDVVGFFSFLGIATLLSGML